MKELIAVKAGDYAIINGQFKLINVKVDKVTPQKVFFHQEGWGNRPRQEFRQRIIFAGSEQIATRLYSELIESARLYADETRASLERKRERDAKAIAAASNA